MLTSSLIDFIFLFSTETNETNSNTCEKKLVSVILITALLVKVKLSLIFQVRTNKQRSPTTNSIDQEPVDRLGTVAEGREDGSKDDQESLQSHDFFKEIDWTALEEVKNDQ